MAFLPVEFTAKSKELSSQQSLRMRSLTGGVCIKLLTKLRHNQRSPLTNEDLIGPRRVGVAQKAPIQHGLCSCGGNVSHLRFPNRRGWWRGAMADQDRAQRHRRRGREWVR